MKLGCFSFSSSVITYIVNLIMEKVDVKITRVSNFLYSFKLSTKNGIRHVAKALTFRNPNPYAYQQTIMMYDRNKFVFKIGMFPTLVRYLKEHGVSYEVEDYDFDLPEGIVIDDRMSGKYIHQANAVRAFYKRRFGIIQVPTRGGKTFIMSEILRIFLASDEGNFMFCVDSTDLFTQAVGDIKRFFERYGGVEVGEIRAGHVDTSCRVTVAMLQTIQSTLSERCGDKDKKKKMKNFMKGLKFLSVDEIHDNASDSRLKLYKSCKNIDYLLLLSATPYKSETPMQNLKLQQWSGDIVYRITEEELRKRHVLSDYKVFLFAVNHNEIDYKLEDDDYRSLRDTLIFNSDVRNSTLVNVIRVLEKLKLKTLVLFQSIEHGETISARVGHPFISGKTKNKERERRKNEFLSQPKGGVLLASDIFKKGITLPECEVIIIVDEGLEVSSVIQKKGRTLGVTETKTKSLVVDFIDIYDVYFSEHSESRLETYVSEIGEKNVGILDVTSDDCMFTFKEWCKKWFDI